MKLYKRRPPHDWKERKEREKKRLVGGDVCVCVCLEVGSREEECKTFLMENVYAEVSL